MATKTNLIVDQGTDFTTSLEIRNEAGDLIDITGYTINAMIRKTYSSTNSVSFAPSNGGNTGIVTLQLSANTGANMTPGRFVYDVILTDLSAKKMRVVEGILTLSPGVSR